MIRKIIKDYLQYLVNLKDYIINMEQNKIKEVYLTGQPPYKLHIGMLEGIDLNLYPKQKTHYLAYALQYGLKLPSIASMHRSELRNQAKKSSAVADPLRNRTLNAVDLQRISRKRFVVPNRFGRKPIKSTKKSCINNYCVAYRSRRRSHIFLPAEIVRKNQAIQKPKRRSKAFITSSPQLLVLKAQRRRFLQQIEKYRLNQKQVKPKQIPMYFKKKKASQQRRRQEKYYLIRDNCIALYYIFGNAVFKRGWPISRKQIKMALGIKEEDHDYVQGIADFMYMAENANKNPKILWASDINKIKNRLHPSGGQNSRMVRKGPPISQRSQSREIKSVAELIPSYEDDQFPSLLNR